MRTLNFRFVLAWALLASPLLSFATDPPAPVVPSPVVPDPDAAARGDQLRTALSILKPGSILQLDAVLYDIGHEKGNLTFPDGVTVRGAGRELTRILSSVHSDAQGTAFNMGDGTILEDLQLDEQTYAKNEDGRTVGFDPIPGRPSPRSATIRRCIISGGDWCVYNWNNEHHSLRIEDSDIRCCRVGVASMGSGGEDSQFFDLLRCRIIGDASQGAHSIGATSNQKYGGVFGVVIHGGRVRLIDCEIDLKGKKSEWPSWTPRCVGITDNFAGGPGHCFLEVLNLRCHTEGNGATECFDLDVRDPTLAGQKFRMMGGWGTPEMGCDFTQSPYTH